MKNLTSKKTTGILLIAYILCVVFYTLFSRAEGFYEAHFDLFWSYRTWLSGDTIIGGQILLNMALFMPLGFMLAAWKDEWSLRRRLCCSLLLSGLISAGIETSQLVFQIGTFEFDDMLNNTVGGALGCLCYFLFIRIVNIEKISSFIPIDRYFDRILVAICCLFVVVAVFECITVDKQKNNDENWVAFQLDDISADSDEIELTGFCMGYKYSPVTHLEIEEENRFNDGNYGLILRSMTDGTEVELNVERGLSRPDVNEYLRCETDYTDVGFTATADPAGIEKGSEYAVIIRSDKRDIETGTYIKNGAIEHGTEAENKALDVQGTDLEPIVTDGYLMVDRPDKHCTVYQYQGNLYWIVDDKFKFESDGSTYIQYQLWTTQKDKIPVKRTINEWYWDNIGFTFESREITDQMDCGKYRVAMRRIPTEYSITAIIIGYHKDGKWKWSEYFRPHYNMNDLNRVYD